MIKIGVILLFECLSFSINGQSQNKCSIQYEKHPQDSLIGSDLIIEDSSYTLFTWSQLMGDISVKPLEGWVQITCYANTINITNNELSYVKKACCKISVERASCKIQREMLFQSTIDTIKEFEKNKSLIKTYPSDLNIDSLDVSSSVDLITHAYNLMCCSLNGSSRCRDMFNDFLIHFPFMQYGLNGRDYFAWKLILEELK